MSNKIIFSFLLICSCIHEQEKRYPPVAGTYHSDQEKCEQLDLCILHCDTEECDYYCEQYLETDQITCAEIQCKSSISSCKSGSEEACMNIPYDCGENDSPRRQPQ